MKHRTLAIPVALFALLLIVSSCAHCGLDTQVSEHRDVNGFDSVSLETDGRLEVIQGDREGLSITATPSMLKRIRAEVRDGVLYIGYRGLFRKKGFSPVFELYIKNAKGIRAASLGAITAQSITAESLYIEASSSGTVELGVLSAADARILMSSSGDVHIGVARLSMLEASLTSRGDLTVAGETGDMSIDASASGSFNGEALKASSASIRLSSSGGASVWVLDHLDASLSGKGNLKYFGTPETGSLSATGSGEIIGLGPK